jgi:hypothetical protein
MPGNSMNKITSSDQVYINDKVQVETCHRLGDAAAGILERIPQVFFSRTTDMIRTSVLCECKGFCRISVLRKIR